MDIPATPPPPNPPECIGLLPLPGADPSHCVIQLPLPEVFFSESVTAVGYDAMKPTIDDGYIPPAACVQAAARREEGGAMQQPIAS